MKKWTRPRDYFGAEWPEYYVFLGRHRDSGVLDNSNFEVALKELGGETETVFIVCENHWAVGWVEWIAIHESDKEAIKLAESIEEKLENYPILDEMDYSERENEYANETWRNCFDLKDRVELCQKYGISVFAARHDYIPYDDCGNLYEYLTSEC